MDLLAEDLFKTARNDLESAINLFDSFHYNTAIYHLQQSVEKCTKSFGLLEGLIEEEDLKSKIGHTPHKVFVRMLQKRIEEINTANLPILVPELIPLHQRNIDNSSRKEFLSESYTHAKNLTLDKMEKIDESEIADFVEGAKYFDKELVEDEDIFQEIKNDFVKTQEHFREYFKIRLKENDDSPVIKLIDLYLENPDPFVYEKLFHHKQQLKINHNSNFLFYVLYNLSIITAPHEQSTRYYLKKSARGPDAYNRNHPMVQFFNDFAKLMQRCFIVFEEIYRIKIEKLKVDNLFN